MKIEIKKNLKKFLNFLKEIRSETKKINWPSINETLKYTLIVIFVSILIAIFLGGIDFLLTIFLNRFIL